jgi:hypothetical protein
MHLCPSKSRDAFLDFIINYLTQTNTAGIFYEMSLIFLSYRLPLLLSMKLITSLGITIQRTTRVDIR